MSTKLLNLQNKHVAITGASSGLGEALAIKIAEQGGRVTLLARRQELLESIAAHIIEQGGTALAIPTDVTSQKSVEDAISQAVDEFGPVDILIANSGISPVMSAQELDIDVVSETMHVNFFGVAYTMNAVLPSMIERQSGVILAISSIAAFRGLPTSNAYCASKAAITAWMQSLRPELKQCGVTLITSHPGYIDTPMLAGKENDRPFLVDVNDAADRLIEGIRKKKTEVNFPWQLVLLARVASHLPNRLYDKVMMGKSKVSWGTAAKYAFFWSIGGALACSLLWLLLKSVAPETASTIKTIYAWAFPVAGLFSLIVSRLLHGTTKVPILILVMGTVLTALASLGWFFS